jgi:putative endonuclease
MPRKDFHCYYVYILASKKHGTIYVGMSGGIDNRMEQHKLGVFESFTKRYKVKLLVYYEEYQWVNDAAAREKKLKKWKRQWKIDLIEKDNPEWTDLTDDWKGFMDNDQ